MLEGRHEDGPLFVLLQGCLNDGTVTKGILFSIVHGVNGGELGAVQVAVRARRREGHPTYHTEESPHSRTPLKAARKDHALAHWLILKGAVCSNVATGEIDREVLRRDLNSDRYWDERSRLLAWAQSYGQTHHNFMVFLGGTLSDDDSEEGISGENEQQEDNSTPLQSLRGKAGVLELIADYVGFGRSRRDLRLMRGFAAELEDFLKDVPSRKIT